MSKIRMSFIFCALTLLSIQSFSQDFLTTLPSTKEEFIKSEAAVINTIEWLEDNPRNKNSDARKMLKANFTAWVINSPTVTIEMNQHVLPFLKKNDDLLITFMGGWTKYSLQNNYSKDVVKCNYAGIKSAIKVYQMGNGLKKDKQMDMLIELDNKNELENWITEQLAKK